MVVSDDHGYDPAIQHLCRQGVQASRYATHVTDPQPAASPKSQPKTTTSSTPDPAATPRYSGVQEQWRQILLSYPNVTESDVAVCMKYLPTSMGQADFEKRVTQFHNGLVRYYKNLNLTNDMYERVKPAIRHIAEHGPLIGKAKKTIK